ncbi:hypothetical protein ACFV0O_26355 [Kitasatospora sp. NPDC059577]|uniref:hypothetical protein n=1 Tax=Kitasatospora sp. NPDC059577 TaxID=3346873 RepID=UPI0036AF1A8A
MEQTYVLLMTNGENRRAGWQIWAKDLLAQEVGRGRARVVSELHIVPSWEHRLYTADLRTPSGRRAKVGLLLAEPDDHPRMKDFFPGLALLAPAWDGGYRDLVRRCAEVFVPYLEAGVPMDWALHCERPLRSDSAAPES